MVCVTYPLIKNDSEKSKTNSNEIQIADEYPINPEEIHKYLDVSNIYWIFAGCLDFIKFCSGFVDIIFNQQLIYKGYWRRSSYPRM